MLTLTRVGLCARPGQADHTTLLFLPERVRHNPLKPIIEISQRLIYRFSFLPPSGCDSGEVAQSRRHGFIPTLPLCVLVHLSMGRSIRPGATCVHSPSDMSSMAHRHTLSQPRKAPKKGDISIHNIPTPTQETLDITTPETVSRPPPRRITHRLSTICG